MSFVLPGSFPIEDEDDEDWLLPPPKPDAYPPGTKPLSIEELLKDVRLSDNAGTLSRKIAKHQKRAVRRQSSVTSLSSVAEEEKESEREREREPLWNVTSTPYAPTPVSDDDEDFQDASDSFSEEVLRAITQKRANVIPSSCTGQSLARPIMSQSLVKVEEEEPITEFKQISQNNKRHSRSASVSPRPISNSPRVITNNTRNDVPNDENETFSLASRNVLGRRSLGAQPMKKVVYASSANSLKPTPKRSLLISSTFASRDHIERTKPIPVANGTSQNGVNTVVDNQKNSAKHTLTIQSSSSPRPTLLVTDLHPSIQSVQDIARQQEEALREEVLKQQLQQQQVERKHSWQGDGSEPPSVNTSMGSLTSSKSVDIAGIVKTPRANGAQSKLPRRTGIPLPTKVAHSIVRNPIASLAKPQPSNDEDEFF